MSFSVILLSLHIATDRKPYYCSYGVCSDVYCHQHYCKAQAQAFGIEHKIKCPLSSSSSLASCPTLGVQHPRM